MRMKDRERRWEVEVEGDKEEEVVGEEMEDKREEEEEEEVAEAPGE